MDVDVVDVVDAVDVVDPVGVVDGGSAVVNTVCIDSFAGMG